ncbi:hypothetical protein BGZ57DRAFT_934518 [Hyaloscypha finlandica]|nr:hypothetical protein BGZ57DRAFT_934518 [Hyaloscypha finlandica]
MSSNGRGEWIGLRRRESFGQADAAFAPENTLETASFTPSPTPPIHELGPKRRYVYIWQCVSFDPKAQPTFIET